MLIMACRIAAALASAMEAPTAYAAIWDAPNAQEADIEYIAVTYAKVE